jgi:molybdopterin-binding protein
VNVAALRKRLGLSQVRLAEILGVHPMTVSRWERGRLEPSVRQRELLGTLAGGAPARSAEELASWLNRALVEVTEVGGMKLSASNQLRGKIVSLEEGPVSARVVIEIAPRVRITSLITTASARRLGLKLGKRVAAIIKATEVIVGAP